jgi:hypothetical protein
MRDDKILHVTVVDATENELKQLASSIKNDLQKHDGIAQVVFSSDDVQITELPAIDMYVDEVAEKVAENLNDNNDN